MRSWWKLNAGGGRGIGKAIAQSFAKAGARGVFLVSRTETQLVQSQKVIQKDFPDVLVGYQAGDIADEGSVAEIFRRASELLGPLDVLVFTLYEGVNVKGQLCWTGRTLSTSCWYPCSDLVGKHSDQHLGHISRFQALYQSIFSSSQKSHH